MGKRICTILVLFVCLACIEPIEFQPENDERVLVVDGLLTDQLGTQSVRINNSSLLGSQVFIPFTDAEVQILDDDGNTFLLAEAEPGVYSFEGAAVEGRAYTLKISRNGEELAESSIEVTPPQFLIDSVSFEEKLLSYTNIGGNTRNLWSVEFYAHTSKTFAEQDYYLRFGDLESVFMFPEIETKVFPPPKNCYVYNFENRAQIQTFQVEEGAENVNIKAKVLSKQTTYDFAFVYSVKSNLYSISKESYEFWNKVSILFNQSGSISDPLPAQFSGNIKATGSTLIIGNFSVVSSSSAFKLARRSDLFRPPLKYCGSNGGPYPFPVPDYCFECLQHPGAVTEIPSYW